MSESQFSPAQPDAILFREEILPLLGGAGLLYRCFLPLSPVICSCGGSPFDLLRKEEEA